MPTNTKERMLLLADLDGCGADWNLGVDLDYDLHHPHLPNLLRGNTRTWGFEKNGTEEERRAMRETCTRPGFYRTLPLIEGYFDALNEMRADGHTVFIVTSPYDTNPTCHQDKIDWVREHGGREWGKRVILTEDKTLIHGDILFDDKPDIGGVLIEMGLTPSWEHVYYTQHYNAQRTDKRRINAWSEWRSIVHGKAVVS